MRIMDLSEKVQGGVAVVYHRTKTIENVHNIVNHGYTAGPGNSYGQGIYSTYDFESQQKPQMVGSYGSFVLKNKVHLQGYLIFDEPVARLVYGDAGADLLVQCERFRIDPELVSEFRSRMIRYPNWKQRSSGVASAWGFSHTSRDKVNGLVFTGDTDGRVVVTFQPHTIIPYAYTVSGREDLDRILPEQFEWTPLDAKKAISRRFGRKPQDTRLGSLLDMFGGSVPNRTDLRLMTWFAKNHTQFSDDDATAVLEHWWAERYRWSLVTNFKAAFTDQDRQNLVGLAERAGALMGPRHAEFYVEFARPLTDEEIADFRRFTDYIDQFD